MVQGASSNCLDWTCGRGLSQTLLRGAAGSGVLPVWGSLEAARESVGVSGAPVTKGYHLVASDHGNPFSRSLEAVSSEIRVPPGLTPSKSPGRGLPASSDFRGPGPPVSTLTPPPLSVSLLRTLSLDSGPTQVIYGHLSSRAFT